MRINKNILGFLLFQMIGNFLVSFRYYLTTKNLIRDLIICWLHLADNFRFLSFIFIGELKLNEYFLVNFKAKCKVWLFFQRKWWTILFFWNILITIKKNLKIDYWFIYKFFHLLNSSIVDKMLKYKANKITHVKKIWELLQNI